MVVTEFYLHIKYKPNNINEKVICAGSFSLKGPFFKMLRDLRTVDSHAQILKGSVERENFKKKIEKLQFEFYKNYKIDNPSPEQIAFYFNDNDEFEINGTKLEQYDKVDQMHSGNNKKFE